MTDWQSSVSIRLLAPANNQVRFDYRQHPKDEEGNVFSLSTTGVVPQSQVLSKVSGPRSFLGGGGTPVLPGGRVGGYPNPGWGQDREPPGTGHAACGTPRAVSRRRTFLFDVFLSHLKSLPSCIVKLDIAVNTGSF